MKTSYLPAILLLVFLAACTSAKSTQIAPPQPSPTPVTPSMTISPSWTVSPTLAPTAANTQTITPTNTTAPFLIHTAKTGDTCSSISTKYKITIAQLLDANPGLKGDCFKLLPGIDLVIPVPDSSSPTTSATDAPAKTLPTVLKSTQAVTKAILPTLAATMVPTKPPVPTSPPLPTSPPAPTNPPAQVCCKVCSNSKACGDSCISKDKTCHQPPGCACQG